MKLEAEVEGERHTVEIAGSEGHLQVVLDGEALSVDACAMEGFFYSLLVGGKGYEVTVEPDGEDFRVQVGIDAWRVRFLDPLRGADKESGAGRRGGRRTVTALMPGKVVRVLSRPGDEVEEGRPLLVVEAMKMENEVLAPSAGRVVEIKVSAGDAVEVGELLVVIG